MSTKKLERLHAIKNRFIFYMPLIISITITSSLFYYTMKPQVDDFTHRVISDPLALILWICFGALVIGGQYLFMHEDSLITSRGKGN